MLGFYFLVFYITENRKSFLRYKDGQLVFLIQPVADVVYSIIGELVGIILIVVYKVDRAKKMWLWIYSWSMWCKDVLILLPCYCAGKLLSDFMAFA